MMIGVALRQQRGHWDTTPANAWGTIAARRFAAAYPSAAAGIDHRSAARRTQTGTGPAAARRPIAAADADALPASGRDRRRSLLSHSAQPTPWATISVRAAVPLTAPRLRRLPGQPRGHLPRAQAAGPAQRRRRDQGPDHASRRRSTGPGWWSTIRSRPAPRSSAAAAASRACSPRRRAAATAGRAISSAASTAWRAYFDWLPQGRTSVEYVAADQRLRPLPAAADPGRGDVLARDPRGASEPAAGGRAVIAARPSRPWAAGGRPGPAAWLARSCSAAAAALEPPGPGRRPARLRSEARSELAGERGLASRPRRAAAPDRPDRFRRAPARLGAARPDRALAARGGGRFRGPAFRRPWRSRLAAPSPARPGPRCAAARRAARARSACSSPASSRPSSAGRAPARSAPSCARPAPPGRSRREWSKDEILEAYLNLASFRGETQGIGAAARALFGRAPGRAGREDSLLLAALLPAPQAAADRRRPPRLPARPDRRLHGDDRRRPRR